MPSGGKEMVINNLERAVSADTNRAQKFANSDRAELLRFLLDASMGTDDLQAGGVLTQYTTANSPLNAEIMGAGLTVKPLIGVADLLVDPGVLMLLNPDGAPDDSNYKYVNDPGIPAPGVGFVMSANASGSTRIDVIECTNQQNALAETDNRDIFNPATGAFNATTVSKATKAFLSYRVRLGTPGAGYPGTATGWLPLAIAKVPTGTTTNDTITFWDVRPLVADRLFALANTQRDFSRIERVHLTVDQYSFSGRAVCTGWVDANSSNQINSPAVPGGTRLGGRLRTGGPTADLVNLGGGLPDGLDLNDANNQSGTWIAGQPVYLYLLEPFLLPRWARYTDVIGSGFRVPRSPRGIPVLSPIAPLHFWGCPSASVALPASFGFGAATANKGVCIAATIGLASQKIVSFVADGKAIFPNADPITGDGFFSSTAAASVVANTSATWGLVDGTTHPANAKALWISLQVPLSLAAATYGSATGKVTVNNGSGPLATAVTGLPVLAFYNGSGGTLGQSYVTGTFRIPIATGYPATTVNRSLVLSMGLIGFTGITPAGSCIMTVVGYEF
jgi:hypothetical protein